MPNVASVGRSFPSLSDSGKHPVSFLRLWIGLSLVYFFDVLFYRTSHPPAWEDNVSHCSGFLSWLDGRGELLFWLSLGSSSWVGKLGGGSSVTSGVMVQKFFNRSPITLKFGGRKLERESQEREREREQVVIFFLFASWCCYTLVSCYSILVSWYFYTCNLWFYACKLLFFTCKLLFYMCNLLFYTCKF